MSDMKPYVIRKGDYLTKLGHERGFQPSFVWNHPRNEGLVAERRSWDMLQPGDIVYLPDDPRRTMAITAEASNRYVARVPKVTVTLVLTMGGRLLAKEPYVVRGMGRKTTNSETKDEISGETDDKGVLELHPSVHVKELEVVLPLKKKELRLFLAGLAPENTDSGVRMRLKNLGYLGSRHQGADRYEAMDRVMLQSAVRAFQVDRGLEGTGEVDDATRQKLVEVHGS